MFEHLGPDAPLMIGAALMAGLAVGLVAHALASRARFDRASVRPDPRLLRERARTATPVLRLAARLLPVFTPFARALPLPSVRKMLADRYARAGWPGGFDSDELLAVSLMLGSALVPPIALALTLLDPLLAPLGILGLAAGPGLVSSSLDRLGAEREREITKAMPFVLDLLVLTMHAGAALQQAIERVALDYSGHPVGVEFQAVLTDLDMGVTTAEGFKNLAERVPIPAVKTFVDDLCGAEELGRPMAEIFERQSVRARERRVQESLETAGRAKVTVLVPGMLVFMASLLLLFAPFVVRYYYGGYTAG